jgi:hypothetical protein
MIYKATYKIFIVLNSYFYATEPFRNLDFNKYAIHHNTKDIENVYKPMFLVWVTL